MKLIKMMNENKKEIISLLDKDTAGDDEAGKKKSGEDKFKE